jgi:hypothetical protein
VQALGVVNTSVSKAERRNRLIPFVTPNSCARLTWQVAYGAPGRMATASAPYAKSRWAA